MAHHFLNNELPCRWIGRGSDDDNAGLAFSRPKLVFPIPLGKTGKYRQKLPNDNMLEIFWLSKSGV
jgi:hypothetical protein